MGDIFASIEVGFTLPISPLKPLRNRLCLLKALGLPIRIEDEYGTNISNKCAFVFVAYLPLATLIFVQVVLALTSGTNINNEGLQELLKEDGFKKWDLYTIQFHTVVCAIIPLFYLPSYKRVGVQLNQFIQLYQSTLHHLETGNILKCINIYISQGQFPNYSFNCTITLQFSVDVYVIFRKILKMILIMYLITVIAAILYGVYVWHFMTGIYRMNDSETVPEVIMNSFCYMIVICPPISFGKYTNFPLISSNLSSLLIWQLR